MDQNKVKFNIDKCEAPPEVNKFQLVGADLAPCQFPRRVLERTVCGFCRVGVRKVPPTLHPQSEWGGMIAPASPFPS